MVLTEIDRLSRDENFLIIHLAPPPSLPSLAFVRVLKQQSANRLFFRMKKNLKDLTPILKKSSKKMYRCLKGKFTLQSYWLWILEKPFERLLSYKTFFH